jgi:hypothetical protein
MICIYTSYLHYFEGRSAMQLRIYFVKILDIYSGYEQVTHMRYYVLRPFL